MTKVCTGCKQEKLFADFSTRKKGDKSHRAGAPLSRCKECERAKRRDFYWTNRDAQLQASKDYQALNPEKRYIATLAREYGLTPEEYDFMFASQGNACAICRVTDVRWFVDHDHATGKVRGILCPKCNSALGFAKDSPEILRAAAQYLERSRSQFPDS